MRFRILRAKFLQRPSSVSAIKIAGKAAHQRVREGETVEIPPREVEIYKLEIKEIRKFEDFIEVDVEVQCSSGTYIRSIARDLGEFLNCGGHLTKLKRTEVAPFTIKESKEIESANLISIADGVSRILPTRTLTLEEEREIYFGRPISRSDSEMTAAFRPNGEFAALLTNKEQSGKLLSFPSLVNVKE